MLDLCRIASETACTLEFQPEVDSTNDWALRLVTDDERCWPLLVLTGKQTAGRGRGANVWWATEGALTFSLVVDPSSLIVPFESWPQVALVCGLAICEALEPIYPRGVFGLKWPNDVYLNGRKVCGVLVEASANTPRRLVIGVGINVNNSFTSAPAELRETATSLSDTAGAPFDLSETLIAVVQRMLCRIDQFGAASGEYAGEFQQYCLLTGRLVQVDSGRSRLAGRCQGIDSSGALVVATPEGIKKLYSGTVINWE